MRLSLYSKWKFYYEYDFGNFNTLQTNFLYDALISYVDARISNLVGGASTSYDTLLEIQNILTNNKGTIDTILVKIATKQNIFDSNNRLDASNIGIDIINSTLNLTI